MVQDVGHISVAIWNTNGLFGTLRSQGDMARQKHAQVQQLLRSYMVVGLQETHGIPTDCEALPTSHLWFGSFAPSNVRSGGSSWGGVLLAIHKDLVSRALEWSHIVLRRGRVHLVALRFHRGTFVFMNVHLDIAAGIRQLRLLFGKMSRTLNHLQHALCFVFGDFNFVHLDDRRLNLTTKLWLREPTSLPGDFEKHLSMLTEVRQHNFTRRSFPSAESQVLSRIDRFYLNFPADMFKTMLILSDVVGDLFDASNPSDHVPVMLSLVLCRNRHALIQQPVPLYITEAPCYAGIVDRMAMDIPIECLPPEYHAAIKDIMHAAVPLARRALLASGCPPSRLVLRELFRLLRASRFEDEALGRQVFVESPCLRGLVHADGAVPSQGAILARIAALVRETCDQETAAIDSSEAPETHKQQRRERARKRADPWRLTRKRVAANALLDADGAPVVDPAGIGPLLSATWQPIFEEPALDEAEIEYFLQFVPEHDLLINWHLPFDKFEEVLDGVGHSSPGPDGLPYGTWVGSCASRTHLHNLYLHLLEHPADLPLHFNLARMVFIPKEDCGEQEGIRAASAAKLRPITCSNTDAKIIALALNQPLGFLAQLLVSPMQRGFIQGRMLCDNIIELETSMLVNSATSRFAACVLFDFATAFPSIAHRWLFAVLEAYGVPSEVLNLIKALYSDCEALLCFGGSVVGKIGVRSGIKQGCPLSGSIFALAIDPLLRLIAYRTLIRSSSLNAYADDIGTVLYDLFGELPVVLGVFGRWQHASGLALNPGKCILILLWQALPDEIMGVVAYLLASFCTLRHLLFGKVLGCLRWTLCA